MDHTLPDHALPDHTLPDHAVLRPGVPVLRRHDGRLQVGVTPGDRVLLPDTPEHRELAAHLQRCDADVPDRLAPLAEPLRHLLVPGGDLLVAEPEDRTRARAEAYRVHGRDAAAVLAARADCRVEVVGPESWRRRATSLLEEYGVPAASPAAGGAGDVRLLLHVGEPAVELCDATAREQPVHVWAGSVAGQVTVGPFVDPGRTGCRSCDAAGRSADEPGWAMLRRQLSQRSGTVPEPCDPGLMAIAVAWAVRDVVTWLDGGQPSTWSAVVEVDERLTLPRRRVRREAACGCSWTGAWVG